MKTRTKVAVFTLASLLAAYLGLVSVKYTQSRWDDHLRRKKVSELADKLNEEKSVVKFKIYNPPPIGLVGEGTFGPGMYYLVGDSLYKTNDSNLAEIVLDEDLSIYVANGSIASVSPEGDPYGSLECNPQIAQILPEEWQTKVQITAEDVLNGQRYWIKAEKGNKVKYYWLVPEGIRIGEVNPVLNYFEGPKITFYGGGGVKVEKQNKK